jgi:hypothetical protein
VWLVAGALVAFLIWRDPAGTRQKRQAPVDPPAPTLPTPAAAIAVDAGMSPVIDGPAAPLAIDTVTEALDDIAASPLTFVGTGEWFGNATIHACAYRNERVLVVNVYCTVKETPAFSIVVLSPTRGRLRIYAEADAAISTLKRAEYQTFDAEVQPPLDGDALALSFTYAELRAWDERRYNSHLGACWYANAEESCSGGLAPKLSAWSESFESSVTSSRPACPSPSRCCSSCRCPACRRPCPTSPSCRRRCCRRR